MIVDRKVRFAKRTPVSSVPTVEDANCQKNKVPACVGDIDHRSEIRGRIGPRRVVTMPRTTKREQANKVKAADRLLLMG
jgi:hypothetical protein